MSGKRKCPTASKTSTPKRIKRVVGSVEVKFVNKSEFHLLYEVLFWIASGKLCWKDIEHLSQVSHSTRYVIKNLMATTTLLSQLLIKPLHSKKYTVHGYYELLASGLISQAQHNLAVETYNRNDVLPKWLMECHQHPNQKWVLKPYLAENVETFLRYQKYIPGQLHFRHIFRFSANLRLRIFGKLHELGCSLWRPICYAIQTKCEIPFIQKMLEIQRSRLIDACQFSEPMVDKSKKTPVELSYARQIIAKLSDEEISDCLDVLVISGFFKFPEITQMAIEKGLPLKYLGRIVDKDFDCSNPILELTHMITNTPPSQWKHLSIHSMSSATLQSLCKLECFNNSRCIDFFSYVVSSSKTCKRIPEILQHCPIVLELSKMSARAQSNLLAKIRRLRKSAFVPALHIIWKCLTHDRRNALVVELKDMDYYSSEVVDWLYLTRIQK